MLPETHSATAIPTGGSASRLVGRAREGRARWCRTPAWRRGGSSARRPIGRPGRWRSPVVHQSSGPRTNVTWAGSLAAVWRSKWFEVAGAPVGRPARAGRAGPTVDRVVARHLQQRHVAARVDGASMPPAAAEPAGSRRGPACRRRGRPRPAQVEHFPGAEHHESDVGVRRRAGPPICPANPAVPEGSTEVAAAVRIVPLSKSAAAVERTVRERERANRDPTGAFSSSALACESPTTTTRRGRLRGSVPGRTRGAHSSPPPLAPRPWRRPAPAARAPQSQVGRSRPNRRWSRRPARRWRCGP